MMHSKSDDDDDDDELEKDELEKDELFAHWYCEFDVCSSYVFILFYFFFYCDC